ncbi:hypothetical protein BD560DRAFT_418393 [Blakeslea trispora]|nr:hypothetical protein BD560DRAFT_418393 [Blakeslea trispora]
MFILQFIGILLCVTQLTISVFGALTSRQLVVNDAWNCLPGIAGINDTLAAYKNESVSIFNNNKRSDLDRFLEDFFDANGAFIVYKTSCCGQKDILSSTEITFVQKIVNDIKASTTSIMNNAPSPVAPVINLITSGILSTANQIKSCLTPAT